jgi:hypothetical protein
MFFRVIFSGLIDSGSLRRDSGPPPRGCRIGALRKKGCEQFPASGIDSSVQHRLESLEIGDRVALRGVRILFRPRAAVLPVSRGNAPSSASARSPCRRLRRYGNFGLRRLTGFATR